MTQISPTAAISSLSRIKAFWDERARQFGADGRATLRETHLRQVEISAMMARLRDNRPDRVLDVGCGNGWSTRQYAREFPGTRFIGVDYSSEMIRFAKQDAAANCTFVEGNVLDESSLPAGPFSMIITQRCIQNLPDWETQKQAIANLRSRRAANGVVFLMECSRDGVEQLNGVRKTLGFAPIEGIEPWHNCFMHDARMVAELGAVIEYFSSTYMFLAKVVHKKLSYVARYLPAVGEFGYDRIYVLR